jgi:hypothetical protein
MPDKRTRKLLMTIRAALIMAAKAIDLYLREEMETVTVGTSDSISLSQNR